MKIRNIKYYIREAFRSIIRNRLMSVASIITVSCCILILGFSFCIISNLDYFLKNVEGEMSLAVYVNDAYDDKKIGELEKKILNIDHVVSVNYMTSQEAMENFAKGFKGGKNSKFLGGLTDSSDAILPRTFDIHVDDIVNQDGVRNELQKMVGSELEEVKYNKDSVEILIGLSNIIRIASIIIIVFLSIVSIIIIMNTIKLTVNNRKVEINIMKYVGATDWFIRWPFIFEGTLIGLIGAALPTAICFAAYGNVINMIYNSIPAITATLEFKSTQSVFVVLIPFALFLGIAIGSVGSITSIKRHLHV